MQPAEQVPRTGAIYLDARNGARAMRVTWHHEAGVVVLSLWRENVCTGTFRLAVEDLPDLVDLLTRVRDTPIASARDVYESA